MKILEKIEKELREKIIEAVPEIIELKFGCRLKSNYIATIYYAYEDGTMDAFIEIEKGIAKFTIERIPETTEIIGRPITLADVLITKNNNLSYYFLRPYYPSSIQFEMNGKLMAVWDLTKDLDGQKEEVKRFIHEVICK